MLLKEPNFVYESLTASVNIRKNELNRVAIKIASFNMRTWFRGPLLPNRPSLKIKKSKVSRFFFVLPVIVLNVEQNRQKRLF